MITHSMPESQKELLDNIHKYLVGSCCNGEIIVAKGGLWQGYIFVIPDKEYKELFREGGK